MQKESQTYKIAPAERLASVSEYYFSKKLKEVAQMNAEGKDVISLGIGSPDMPPSKETIETLCNNAHDPNGHGYQPYVGIPELRKGFAAWYQRWYGVELNPNTEIQPLIGSKEGILHVTLAFVNPGEQVLVPNPGYPTYTSLSKILGAEVISYDLKEEDGWMPDFEALEKMDLSRVKLMWTNYPNMPTGANATPELYERLVDFARRKNIVIVNDNPYSFILNKKPISILSVPGAKECCIEFNSMSKSHNMPGWRIGMLASNAEFVQWILKVKSNIDSGMFRAMQLAAASCMARNIPLSILLFTFSIHCTNSAFDANIPIRHPGMLWLLLMELNSMQHSLAPGTLRMLIGFLFRIKLYGLSLTITIFLRRAKSTRRS